MGYSGAAWLTNTIAPPDNSLSVIGEGTRSRMIRSLLDTVAVRRIYDLAVRATRRPRRTAQATPVSSWTCFAVTATTCTRTAGLRHSRGIPHRRLLPRHVDGAMLGEADVATRNGVYAEHGRGDDRAVLLPRGATRRPSHARARDDQLASQPNPTPHQRYTRAALFVLVERTHKRASGSRTPRRFIPARAGNAQCRHHLE